MFNIFKFFKNSPSKINELIEKSTKETIKDENYNKNIPQSITECEKEVKKIFNSSSDVVIKTIQTQEKKAMLVYIDGLVNIDLIDRDIIKPLKSEDFNGDVLSNIIATPVEVKNFASFIGEVLDGNVAIFYDDLGKVLSVDFKAWDKRSVETPESESVTRGPKEGFNENFRTNTSLIRRKIKTPKLIFESLVLGRQTNTKIALVYIEGIVNKDVLDELKTRLSKIDTDAILESGYIEQFIEENSYSTIPTVGSTQKPDVLAGRILEGRIGIICDGTPHVLTVPHLLIENLQASEDYYIRTVMSSILRVVRSIALFISIILPGLYVAIITYHHEMVPTSFMTTLIVATQKTPLPAGAEVLFLVVMFELLKESGTRLPKTVGSAISIVGALIIGDAAVSAGLVGAPAVIAVALTAVCSFVTPALNEFITIYRLIFLLLCASMGLVGLCAALTFMLIQVISTESFGLPVLSVSNKSELRDSLVRFPLWKMNLRPSTIAKDNIQRQKKIQ